MEAATGVEVNEPDRIDYTFLKKYSVMVVEDTPELRSYLKETLSNYFARVYVAKDGKEGLEQIKDRRYDQALREDGRNEILAYGIAFYKKRCKVVVERL